MRHSLAFIIALSLAGLQFVAVATVVSAYYLTSERAMLEHARGLMKDAGETALDLSRRFLEPALHLAETSARMLESETFNMADSAEFERFLFQLVSREPQISGMFYGDDGGNFLYVMRSTGPGAFRTKQVALQDGQRDTQYQWRDANFAPVERMSDPDDQYDPRTRPWYVRAVETGGDAWTDPYIFFSSKRPGITAGVPVKRDDGTVQGVVGVDIEIAAISNFLSELTVSPRSLAMILNENGDVIAHPEAGQVVVQTEDGGIRFAAIQELADPVARAAFASVSAEDLLVAGSEVRTEFNFNGEGYLMLTTPLAGIDLPWTVALLAPERDFIQGIQDNRRRNLVIAAVIALVTGLVGVVLSELILRPVRAFAVRTALVSQGEVAADAPSPQTYRELERANETLIDEIAQRRASEAKVKELSQQVFHLSRVDMMGQMATGLAHELSQPLTAITQNVDAALSTAEQMPAPNTELIQILSELDDQAHRGGDIVHALRGMVRKDEGALKPFDLGELMQQTQRLLQPEADAFDVTLTFAPLAYHTVVGNRVQVAQVLVNLIHNAIEAIDDANSPKRFVTVTSRIRDRDLEIWVEDSGPGVDPDLRLFQQFETSKAGGLGLGLSLSKTLIEANHGHLWYDDKAVDTSRFCFTLPLDLAENAPLPSTTTKKTKISPA